MIRAKHGLVLLVLLAFQLLGIALAQAQDKSVEYEIKAAYLYKFTQFITWPTNSLPENDSPFVIGVFGDDRYLAAVRDVLGNKTVNRHPIEVRILTKPSEAASCHILFVGASEKKRMSKLKEVLNNEGVLTVGDLEGFAEAGGVVNFILVQDKIQFEINVDAVERSKLKVS